MATLDDFIFEKRKKGSYTFSLREVIDNLNITYDNAKTTLYRYKTKGEIELVRKGFYVIIPPEYSDKGMLPIYLYIDDLMKHLGKSYYLSLFTAAALHGAGHQQPMESFVITTKPALLNIRNDKQAVNFLIKKGWSEEDILQKKSVAGYFNVSSPELTAFDLIAYMHLSGINRCATIIEELTEVITADKLHETASRFPAVSVLQRLGYLLDVALEHTELSESIYEILKERKTFYVPLSVHHEKKGEFNSKWKIIQNTEIDIDI